MRVVARPPVEPFITLLVEVPVAVALAAVAVAGLGPDPSLLPALFLAAVTPTLIRTDVTQHRLPNRLTYPAMLAGIVGAGVRWIATGIPPLVPLVAALAFGGLLLLLALVGGMGLGDVKLAVALGLASPTIAIAVLTPLAAFLLGGVVSVGVLVRRGLAARRDHIPFGPFLLIGYVAALCIAAVARAL